MLTIRFLVAFAILTITHKLFCQPGFNLAIDVSFPQNQFSDLLVDNDTIVGYGLGFNNNTEWLQGLVLSKFDSSGNLLLSKIILHPPGDFYSIDKHWGKIIKTSDGGYAMTAAPYYSNSAVLIKTDNNFEIEFIKEYPDTINLSNYFYKLLETPEGYLLYGAIQRPDYYDDGFIRYVDKQGNTIWFKYLAYSDFSTVVQDIKRLNDSVYVSVSLTTTHPNFSSLKFFPSFLHFDLEGNEIKYWASPENPDIGIVLKIISVNEDSMLLYGQYLAGHVINTDLFQSTLSQLSTDFETEWVNHFGPVRSAASFIILNDFAPTADGNYIGAGETLVKDGDDPTRRVGWLYKFSAEGDSIWERKVNAPFLPLYYTNSGFFGGVGVLSSGSIVAGGTTNEGNIEYCWLVKVTNDGCLDTLYCQTTAVKTFSNPENKEYVAVYPNPASSYFTVNSVWPVQTITLYNAFGKEILRNEFDHSYNATVILPVGLPQGFYNILITSSDGRTSNKRIFIGNAE